MAPPELLRFEVILAPIGHWPLQRVPNHQRFGVYGLSGAWVFLHQRPPLSDDLLPATHLVWFCGLSLVL